MTIEPDDFTNWREHPVTRAFYERILDEMLKTREAWIGVAWMGGNLSEKEYAYHRSRADTLAFMADLRFDDLFPKEAE